MSETHIEELEQERNNYREWYAVAKAFVDSDGPRIAKLQQENTRLREFVMEDVLHSDYQRSKRGRDLLRSHIEELEAAAQPQLGTIRRYEQAASEARTAENRAIARTGQVMKRANQLQQENTRLREALQRVLKGEPGADAVLQIVRQALSQPNQTEEG